MADPMRRVVDRAFLLREISILEDNVRNVTVPEWNEDARRQLDDKRRELAAIDAELRLTQ